MNRVIIVALALICTALVLGCSKHQAPLFPVQVAPPEKVVTYSGGSETTSYGSPFGQVWDAALSALRSLGIAVLKEDFYMGEIEAKQMDELVVLEIIPTGPGKTDVTIQTSGVSRELSVKIYKAIAARVNSQPPER